MPFLFSQGHINFTNHHLDPVVSQTGTYPVQDGPPTSQSALYDRKFYTTSQYESAERLQSGTGDIGSRTAVVTHR
ncbi:hypothetical protein J6590_069273 [Homalodisca vitripennis]|nr:hypothetical protein J6590_069273 [Homalodisca vitripennis]